MEFSTTRIDSKFGRDKPRNPFATRIPKPQRLAKKQKSNYVVAMTKVIRSLPTRDHASLISVLEEYDQNFPRVCQMYADDAQPGDLPPDLWLASLAEISSMVQDNL